MSVHFHRTPAGRAQFARQNIPQDQISDHPKMFGCELKGCQGRQSTQKEKERLEASVRLITKAKFVPLSLQREKVFISSQGLSRASWGWFFRNQVQQAVIRALCCSAHLRHILHGHSLSNSE